MASNLLEATLRGDAVSTSDARRRIEAVWRIEAPRLIAGLTRMFRDVGLAEEMA
jgi:RNA polymerase sigma-70 factor (ECF subfamily)